MDEIDSALKDPRGIEAHQRRLAFSVSLGAATLLEKYLDKLNVLKSGAKINHLWLKKKKENAEEVISRQVVSPIDSIRSFGRLLDLAYAIEKRKDEFAYGKPVSEKILREFIDVFLILKKEVENA